MRIVENQLLTNEPEADAGATIPAANAATLAPSLWLLTFTTLYPNAAQPNHGVFVENRLRHLVADGRVTSTVIAPLPWFPGRPGPGGCPGLEWRHGLAVHHPRFLAVPGFGMASNPFMLFRSGRRAIARLLRAGLRFDAIDAHYLYPDGVAAVWLGRHFGRKVVITARGSDTSEWPGYALPARLIRRALRDADALVAVSASLKKGLLALGVPDSKVTVLRNGVDLVQFRPVTDRAAVRAELGFEGPTLLSVGHLIPRKGHHLTIEALVSLPDHRLVVVGDGPERAALEALASRLGVAGRVRFDGSQPHARLPQYYSAADIMVLASSREGWANVLLESMACGTPVVATPAWGSAEAVSAPEAGVVAAEISSPAIAAGVRELEARRPSRAATRAHAECFSWDATTEGQIALFRRVLGTVA